MESRIIIEGVWLSDDGARINYKYRTIGNSAEYFKNCPKFYVKYNINIGVVPDSLLLVPLVANLAPIAWFIGCALEVPELDADFIEALSDIKSIFLRDYPVLHGDESPLIVGRAIKNSFSGSSKAMLFSGGVDAYTTYFRHRNEGLELVSVHGADIPIDDVRQWSNLADITLHEPLLAINPHHCIEANLRDFYSHHTNLLVPSHSWWGTVQHGLALNSLLAPLSFIRGYTCSYIASSYTDSIQVLWGSTPEIDNRLSWAGAQVIHDGYEMRRVEKIGLIVSETAKSNSSVNLRVCYSELNNGLNCANCEKCLRTILGLSIFGADPNYFGFKVDSSVYLKILKFLDKGFKSPGSRYFWWELHQHMLASDMLFEFSEGDYKNRDSILVSLIKALEKPIIKSRFADLKLIFSASFPKIFAVYLSIRRLLR